MNTANKYIPPILVSILVAFAPNIVRLPVWIVAWCFLSWGYCFFAARNDWPWPNKRLQQILAVGGFTFGLVTFGGTMGRDAGVALLVLMVGLKPLETRTHRDRMMTIFLTYFLVIANLFYSKALTMTLYMFLSVLVTTAVLIHINHPRGRMTANLALSARIVLQAVPLMLVLFYLFPRIPGSLWGMSKGVIGTTGFSDSLTPGSISELVRSNEIAFRAEFKEKIPGPDRLYWRGLVFWQFNGETWRLGMTAPVRREQMLGKGAVNYIVTLEPHDKRWLFALDIPAMAPLLGRIRGDHTIKSRRRVKQRIRYRVKSYTDYRTGPLKQWERAALGLPFAGNPQARDLSGKWMEETNSPEEVIEKALDYFRTNEFFYTLNPPLLDRDSVDDFLFRTRKGYCEHYASAFAFLMRAAGIPSRIVGGYLGGEINPYGGYLIVRQSDAHAWVEVWLSEKGWVRVDPTSAVAPERVEQGMAAALPPEEISMFLSSPYLKRIVLGWDAVNNLWYQHVMGYSFLSQKRFLSKLGIRSGSWKGPAKTILIAFVIIGGFSVLFYLMLFKRSDSKRDLVQQIYSQFCEKLGRAGLPRTPAQGPIDYTQFVIEARHDLEERVREIIDLYILLRYDWGGNEETLKEFKSLVRQFDPKKGLETS